VRIAIGALLAIALGVALRSRLAVRRARRLERQRSELLEDVGLLQAALLPVVPSRLGPVVTSAAYRPADGPGAGGDFYDVFALDGGEIAVLVGDLSGHGRQALEHTALVRFTLRAYLEAGLGPRGALQTAGTVLERQLGGSLATVAAATYDPRERTLTSACAGHPPPIVLGAQALIPVTASSAPPLGAGVRTGTRQTVFSLPGRTQVCFYTDGLTEARSESTLFGTERLNETLAALGPDATAAALLDRVAADTDARPDDMVACLLSIEGSGSAPKVVMEQLELDAEQAAAGHAERFLTACHVDRGAIDDLVRRARRDAKQAGTVLLQVRLDEGAPQATVLPNNVTSLDAARIRADAAAAQ
jgi:serine phosphatase RsbU (regulator of sigma subunit)